MIAPRLLRRSFRRTLQWRFLLFWIVAWVLLTSAIMGTILALDRRSGAGEGERGGNGP